MEASIFYGILITTVAGLIMGISPTPLKFIRQFKYEQFGFISMPVALLIIPWGVTLIFCKDLNLVLSEIKKGLLSLVGFVSGRIHCFLDTGLAPRHKKKYILYRPTQLFSIIDDNIVWVLTI